MIINLEKSSEQFYNALLVTQNILNYILQVNVTKYTCEYTCVEFVESEKKIKTQ